MPTPAPMPTPAGLPTSADAARALLPGVRIAARERYGRVRMIVLAPFLIVLVQIMGEFLLKWLMQWLKDRESPTASLTLLAMHWDDRAMPEVKAAMSRVAAGDTGE